LLQFMAEPEAERGQPLPTLLALVETLFMAVPVVLVYLLAQVKPLAPVAACQVMAGMVAA
jgi:hypothetical protein